MAVSQARGRGRSRNRTEQGREGPAFLDDLLAMAGSLASTRKEFASSQLEDLADSMRQLSDALPALPTVKTYAETAADSLEDLAGYVMESDLPEIISDARELARRHPLITFGGSLVAGVVLTQLVQARAGAMRSAVRARRQRQPARGRSDDATPMRDDDEAA
jgi:hypothetical protein